MRVLHVPYRRRGDAQATPAGPWPARAHIRGAVAGRGGARGHRPVIWRKNNQRLHRAPLRDAGPGLRFGRGQRQPRPRLPPDPARRRRALTRRAGMRGATGSAAGWTWRECPGCATFATRYPLPATRYPLPAPMPRRVGADAATSAGASAERPVQCVRCRAPRFRALRHAFDGRGTGSRLGLRFLGGAGQSGRSGPRQPRPAPLPRRVAPRPPGRRLAAGLHRAERCRRSPVAGLWRWMAPGRGPGAVLAGVARRCPSPGRHRWPACSSGLS